MTYINKVKIKNFGPFTEKIIKFDNERVNVITGYTDYGKSQLIGSIALPIFGMPSVRWL